MVYYKFFQYSFLCALILGVCCNQAKPLCDSSESNLTLWNHSQPLTSELNSWTIHTCPFLLYPTQKSESCRIFILHIPDTLINERKSCTLIKCSAQNEWSKHYFQLFWMAFIKVSSVAVQLTLQPAFATVLMGDDSFVRFIQRWLYVVFLTVITFYLFHIPY